MKHISRLSVFALCVLLLLALWGCAAAPDNAASDASGQTGSSTAEPPATEPDHLAMLNRAIDDLEASEHLLQEITFTKTVQIGDAAYQETSNRSASFQNIHSDDMQVYVEEELDYGSYTASLLEYFREDCAYLTIDGRSFTTAMTAQEYRDRQLPAVLFQPEHFDGLTAKASWSGTTLHFTDASVPEDWVTEFEDVQLQSASASATLDTLGALRKMEYQITYTDGAIEVTLAVSCQLTSPAQLELDGKIPESTAGKTTAIRYFDAPRMIMRAAGGIYSTDAISSNLVENIYSEAAALSRTQQVTTNTYGSGGDFMARVEYAIEALDYSGTPSSTTLTELYRDGSCTTVTNGGEPVESAVSAPQMRIYCEDIVLSSIFAIDYVETAELEELEDFYCIRLTGTEEMGQLMCSSIYSILTVNLDDYASDSTAPQATGYIAINKHTGLPTAAGMGLEISHTISDVPYLLQYSLDQAIYLCSSGSYAAITEEPLPETQPENPATPLFYKVTGENGQQMWLLGTIHIGDARTAYLPGEIYDAFDASDALAVELNLHSVEEKAMTDPDFAAQLAGGYYYLDGSTIADHLDPELYAAAKALLQIGGDYTAMTEYMKPSLWDDTIQLFYMEQSYALSSDRGVDERLLTLAESQNKTILEVEPGIERLLMTTNFSAELQALLLSETLGYGVSEYNSSASELYELWCQGDEAALTDYLAAEEPTDMTEDVRVLYEEYTKAMSTDRDAHMLEVAKGYLESGDTVFYAVGLAHLLAEDGLVNTLREAGYTVELVSYE